MANLDSPNGFNPIGKIGGGTSPAMNKYNAVAGHNVQIFQGDLCKLNAGNIERGAAADTAFVGVFWGCNFDDSDGKPTFKNNRPAAQVASMFIYDDPYQTFEIQGDAASAQSNLGNLGDINAGTGNTSTGVSAMEVDSANFGGGGKINLRVVGLSDKEGRNEVGSANLLYEVLINEHVYK